MNQKKGEGFVNKFSKISNENELPIRVTKDNMKQNDDQSVLINRS